ncbi:unnamed protein product [Lathyrus sativus]|nr:unnamed protein product [Lathyrus sativus]
MVVEFVAPTLVNGDMEVTIDEVDVAEELEYWENAVTLFALGEIQCMLSRNSWKNLGTLSLYWTYTTMTRDISLWDSRITTIRRSS